MSDYHQDRALLLEDYLRGKMDLHDFQEKDSRLVRQAFDTTQVKGLKNDMHSAALAVLGCFPWVSPDDGQEVPDMETSAFLPVMDDVREAAQVFINAHGAWEVAQQF
jgi:hypothetical protein